MYGIISQAQPFLPSKGAQKRHLSVGGKNYTACFPSGSVRIEIWVSDDDRYNHKLIVVFEADGREVFRREKTKNKVGREKFIRKFLSLAVTASIPSKAVNREIVPVNGLSFSE